jgi:hypothetical protein
MANLQIEKRTRWLSAIAQKPNPIVGGAENTNAVFGSKKGGTRPIVVHLNH